MFGDFTVLVIIIRLYPLTKFYPDFCFGVVYPTSGIFLELCTPLASTFHLKVPLGTINIGYLDLPAFASPTARVTNHACNGLWAESITTIIFMYRYLTLTSKMGIMETIVTQSGFTVANFLLKIRVHYRSHCIMMKWKSVILLDQRQKYTNSVIACLKYFLAAFTYFLHSCRYFLLHVG